MKYEFGRISKVQGTLVQPTKEDSYAMPSKVVMCPVFIDQEEERLTIKSQAPKQNFREKF